MLLLMWGCMSEPVEVVEPMEVAPAPVMTPEDREARIKALEERLKKRKEARGVVDPPAGDSQGEVEDLWRMGRVLLHRGPDGEFDGYRLTAIRRGSLPEKAGFMNGDVIHSVQGMKLNSMTDAMLAYNTLKDHSGKVDVKITRRGEAMTLQVDPKPLVDAIP